MNKIALCMSGYFGSTRDPNSDGKVASDYIKRVLLDKYDIDIFIHTWDVDRKDEISEIYEKNLKDMVVQPQYNFDKETKLLEGDWSNSPTTKLVTLSQAYGRQKSIKIKKEYEDENNFVYDWVIYARFDLGLRDVPTAQPKYRCCEIKFDSEYDNRYLYSKYWNQMNQGFADMWLYSNSKTMDIYSEYYDYIFKYMKLDSDYIRAITNDWPDSNLEDEFSNEIFRKNKSNNNIKIPLNWSLGNNHTMLKWFLIEKKIYPNKLRFPVDVDNYNFEELNSGIYEFKLLGK